MKEEKVSWLSYALNMLPFSWTEKEKHDPAKKKGKWFLCCASFIWRAVFASIMMMPVWVKHAACVLSKLIKGQYACSMWFKRVYITIYVICSNRTLQRIFSFNLFQFLCYILPQRRKKSWLLISHSMALLLGLHSHLTTAQKLHDTWISLSAAVQVWFLVGSSISHVEVSPRKTLNPELALMAGWRRGWWQPRPLVYECVKSVTWSALSGRSARKVLDLSSVSWICSGGLSPLLLDIWRL